MNLRALPALLAVAALAGCASASPGRFTVHGTVDVSGQLMISGTPGATQWVADISNGHCAANPPEQLTVESASHRVLASALLALGNLTPSDDCLVRFTLTGVPSGGSQYGFTIGTAGTVWLPAAQASRARLTLGPAG